MNRGSGGRCRDEGVQIDAIRRAKGGCYLEHLLLIRRITTLFNTRLERLNKFVVLADALIVC